MSRMMTKAELLALFNSATECPDATDWRELAGQLAAALGKPAARRKPPATDATDASGETFAPWIADAPTGKNTARGAVTVTFADGWSRTFNMRAGTTSKGRKPWSIGPAVRFAVLCWKLAACRRVTGSDAAMYFHHKATVLQGKTRFLDGLLSCPEIADVIEADGEYSVAGASRWSPAECNAETAALRAGAVDLSAFGDDIDAARIAVLAEHERMAAPFAMIEARGAMRAAMRERTRATAERIEAALWPKTTFYHYEQERALSEAFGIEPSEYDWETRKLTPLIEHVARRTTPHGAEFSDYQIPALPAPAPAPVVEDVPDPDDFDEDAAIFDAAPEDDGDLSEDDADVTDAQPAQPRPVIVGKNRDGNWTTYRNGVDVRMEEVFPGHVIVIEGSHRANARGTVAGLVTGLPYPQSGYVVEIGDIVDGSGKGCRVAGPRCMTKLYRKESARYVKCCAAAETVAAAHDLDFTRDSIVPRHGLDYRPTRVKMIADAMFAFGLEDFSTFPMGRVITPLSYTARLDALMNCKTEACKYARARREDDLRHVWPGIEEDDGDDAPAPASVPRPAMAARFLSGTSALAWKLVA